MQKRWSSNLKILCQKFRGGKSNSRELGLRKSYNGSQKKPEMHPTRPLSGYSNRFQILQRITVSRNFFEKRPLKPQSCTPSHKSGDHCPAVHDVEGDHLGFAQTRQELLYILTMHEKIGAARMSRYGGINAHLGVVPAAAVLVGIDTGSPSKPSDAAHRASLVPQAVLAGHDACVNAVSFSPDGSVLASASGSPLSSDQSIRLWDPHTRSQHRALRGHSGSVLAVGFSSGGQLLASSSSDKSVRVWEISSGKEKAVLLGHTLGTTSVTWGSNNDLATASFDGSVKIWDAERGIQKSSFGAHSSSVRAIAFSPDGRTLASASDDGKVRLWEQASGVILRCFEGHRDWVRAVAFSPDGKSVASASDDRTLRVWDRASGRETVCLSSHSRGITTVAWSSAVSNCGVHNAISSGSYDGSTSVWDADRGIEVDSVPGTVPVLGLAWGSNGMLAVAGGTAMHDVSLRKLCVQ